jgi:peptidoglycan/LPS O-acetylase OafA/YrhL
MSLVQERSIALRDLGYRQASLNGLTVSKNIPYNPAIDHLRAFAATLILYYHARQFILPYVIGSDGYGAPLNVNPLHSLLAEGHSAVGFFMVLSGFIFTVAALGKTVSYVPFLFNRFLRIYPLMLAILGLAVFLHPAAFRLEPFTRTLLIPLQLPPPFSFGETLSIQPWTEIFWTITPEFQFYLIFPLLLMALNRYGITAVIGFLVGALVIRTIVSLQTDLTEVAYWTIIGRIDEFLIGMGAAALWRHSLSTAKTERYLPLAIFAVLAALWTYNYLGGVTVHVWWKAVWPTAEGLMWAAFIVCYLDFEKRIPRVCSGVLVFIGQCSYSIYLLHWPIEILSRPAAVTIAQRFSAFGVSPEGSSLLATTLFFVPVILLVSLFSFRCIERPFLTRRVRYLTRPTTAGQSAAATLSYGGELRPAA